MCVYVHTLCVYVRTLLWQRGRGASFNEAVSRKGGGGSLRDSLSFNALDEEGPELLLFITERDLSSSSSSGSTWF